MNETNYSDLLPDYVLGTLEAEQRRELERRLEESPELERELREWVSLLEQMAGTTEAAVPSETTRARVLKRARAQVDAPDQKTGETAVVRRWFPYAAAAGFALLSVVLGLENARIKSDLTELAEQRGQMENEIRLLRGDLDRARGETRVLTAAQRIVAAPQARVAVLAGLEGSPDASANTYVDEAGGRAVFYASGLSPLSGDKTYQLWFIGGEGPVSGGIFEPDETGGATLLVDAEVPTDQPLVWAVTVEPAGGVPQPTGEMVLKS